MKKIILFLIISGILVSSSSSYAKQLNQDKNCHSFLGIQFIGTMSEAQRKPSLGSNGRGYYYSNYEEDCTNADIKYYSFLVVIFSILSGIGYLGYRKYKAKKLVTQSNIEP